MTTNKAAAMAWLDALQGGDIDAFRVSMTDDVVHEIMGSCLFSGVRNRDESCELLGQLLQTVTGGVRLEIDAVTVEEDRVAVMMHGFADLPGGASYNNVYHVLFRIRDGKICQIYEFADTKLVDETIGKLALASDSG
jgi:hypothetical protein